MVGDMHARESRKDCWRKMHLQKAKACEGFTFYEFSVKQAQEHRRAPTHSARISHTDQQTLEEEAGPMALLEEARQCMTKNGLEGLLRIADAPPHAKPEQAATTIDLSEVTEGAVQALIGIKAG